MLSELKLDAELDLKPEYCHYRNDAVQLEEYKKLTRIPQKKQYDYLPAVKITRLGVHKDYQRNNIGTHVLNMVKAFFVMDNRTGCRFLTVDAYNKPGTLAFYNKNGFSIIPCDEKRHTTPMMFDLMRFHPPESFDFRIG